MPNPDYKAAGEVLKAARERKGLSQQDVTGRHYLYCVKALELGERHTWQSASVRLLQKLCDTLDLGFNYEAGELTLYDPDDYILVDKVMTRDRGNA